MGFLELGQPALRAAQHEELGSPAHPGTPAVDAPAEGIRRLDQLLGTLEVARVQRASRAEDCHQPLLCGLAQLVRHFHQGPELGVHGRGVAPHVGKVQQVLPPGELTLAVAGRLGDGDQLPCGRLVIGHVGRTIHPGNLGIEGIGERQVVADPARHLDRLPAQRIPSGP